MGIGDRIGGMRRRAADAWLSLKERRPGIAHVVRGYQHYKLNHGDHLAAAITYFSFLALFPLILLGAAILGFVLASHPGLANDLYKSINDNVPGSFGGTITTTVKTAINNRAGVGLVGLVGLLLTGLGWIANLRTAIDTVWGLPPAKRSFLAAKLSDAMVLIGLGLGIVVSLGVTAGGTAAGGLLLRKLGLNDVTGAGTVTALLGIALGILGSMLVFGWLLIRLPDVEVARTVAWRTTLIAAIGFEVLKLVGTIYIERATKSPAVAVIAPVLGILIWIDLVSRYLLFCVAWAATARPVSQPELLVDEVPSSLARARAERPGPPPVSPIGLAAGLISAGAAIGGAGVAALQRRRQRQSPPSR
ncbi:YihY/virulence factor BrkB family protein [Jatrophihabitans telluris]|uniref:YihY/virulence factor BrkB family protein n=1 Tax=Jatrophihabitans telluris TaxID=2038343 RepID=A0ABY4QWC8_9ACTN|nr:YhjD/YihY/BrkB family envelope integrity protein [Jatrophihabitans telluris]UQX87820.1 YihY/virulence factor BrkB family protein [Jatrophihabitans telluris]